MEELDPRTCSRKCCGVDLPDPFPRLAYADAMSRYGTDKPDLRVPLELTELTDADEDRRVQGVLSAPPTLPGGRVAALRVPGGGANSARSEIDDYTRVRRRSTAPRASPTSR